MSNDPFYKSAAWRDVRTTFLRSRPPCSVTGCNRRAGHVDHIRSRRSGGAALDPRNLQAMCHNHHSQKTAQVDGGMGNAPGVYRPSIRGCDANGRPVDPAHRWNA